MKNNHSLKESGLIGLALCVLFMMSFAGCIGYLSPSPVARVYVEPAPPPPPPPPMPQPVVVVADDYVYYPGYEVYYSSIRREYVYQVRGVWVTGPQPRGVSVAVVLASPSVRVGFRDAPGNHHAEVARKYPKNWKPR